MASEIRVDKINSLSGVGTVTLSPTGVDIAGITTTATFVSTDSTESNSATTGAVTIAGGLGVTKNIYTSGAAYVQGSGGLTVTHDLSIADKIVHTGDTNTSIRFPDADAIQFETGGSQRARIDSSGRLLLGTTSSRGVAGGQSRVQIENTSTEGLSVVRTSNDNGTSLIAIGKTRNGAIVQDDDVVGTLGFYGDDGNDLDRPTAEIRGAVDGTPGADDMPGRLEFKTTADGSSTTTERMRIDSSGRVMIGSGTYIGGAALAVLGTSSTPNAYGSLAIGKVGANPTSGTTLANIRLNGGSVGTGRGAEINAIADANWSDGSSHPTYLTFSTVASSSTSATERIRVHAGGNVDIKTGNLVISTAGKGIDFSATSDGAGTDSSELFDDYEEGTWTPVPIITYNPGNRSITAGTSEGIYVKIGRFVHVEYKVQWTALSGSGTYNIGASGLPYTADSTVDVVSGTARSNQTGYTHVAEGVQGSQINVFRRYDNGSPNENDVMYGFATYQTT